MGALARIVGDVDIVRAHAPLWRWNSFRHVQFNRKQDALLEAFSDDVVLVMQAVSHRHLSRKAVKRSAFKQSWAHQARKSEQNVRKDRIKQTKAREGGTCQVVLNHLGGELATTLDVVDYS